MAFRHNPRSTLPALVSLVAVTLGLLGACGGRSRSIVDPDSEPAPTAGALNVSAGSGGAVSSGGADASPGGMGNVCNNVNCATPRCADGFKLVTPPGDCCSVCQPACTPTDGCPNVICGSGTHLETPDGACCPQCVENPKPSCEQGRAIYTQLRAQLLEKYKMGCSTDTECVALAPVNSCESGCQYEVVWSSAARFFTDNLADSALMNCSTCNAGPIPPCDPPDPPACVMGECRFLIPK